MNSVRAHTMTLLFMNLLEEVFSETELPIFEILGKLHHDQTVSEMATEILKREARSRAEQSRESFEEALAAVLKTEAGKKLWNLTQGARRNERASAQQPPPGGHHPFFYPFSRRVFLFFGKVDLTASERALGFWCSLAGARHLYPPHRFFGATPSPSSHLIKPDRATHFPPCRKAVGLLPLRSPLPIAYTPF